MPQYSSDTSLEERGIKTPDLEATLGTTGILCEVKTINASEKELERRVRGAVGTSARLVDRCFLDKLLKDVMTARTQMLTYSADHRVRRIVFVVTNFDDSTHEYADDYRVQIDQFLCGCAPSDVEVQLSIRAF